MPTAHYIKGVIFFLVLAGFFFVTPFRAAALSGIAGAGGYGTVLYEGSGIITIRGAGVLVTGGDARAVFPESLSESEGCILTADGGCIYTNISGDVLIEGEDMRVLFAGSSIWLTAAGNAVLVLKGYGICMYDREAVFWTGQGTVVELE